MSVNQYATLSEAIERLRERGFTADFQLVDTRLQTPDGGRTFAPEDLRVVEHHRFEGQTDPDDMSVIYAIETRDGVRGIVIDAYGLYADPTLGDLLERAHVASAG